MKYRKGGKIFDFDIPREIGIILDVEPNEYPTRVRHCQHFERLTKLLACAAPRGA